MLHRKQARERCFTFPPHLTVLLHYMYLAKQKRQKLHFLTQKLYHVVLPTDTKPNTLQLYHLVTGKLPSFAERLTVCTKQDQE